MNGERKIILSAAMSLDGCIDDDSRKRLLISSQGDMDAVYRLRAECHAIVVGAETIRKDNPSLITKSDSFRKKRLSAGLPADPIKVTITKSGTLDPQSLFFSAGTGQKLVYCPVETANAVKETIGKVSTIVPLTSETISAKTIVRDLNDRGADIIMVEGGSSIIKMFLEDDMIDYIRLAVAPFVVGASAAPKFINDCLSPSGRAHSFYPVSTEIVDGIFVLQMERRRTV